MDSGSGHIGWIEQFVKLVAGGLMTGIAALTAWIWRTSTKQIELEQATERLREIVEEHTSHEAERLDAISSDVSDLRRRAETNVESRDERFARLEKALARIMNHLTKTHLHDD